MSSTLKKVRTSVGSLPLWGGELCLDFANTVDWRNRADRKDFLADLHDLIDWAVQLGAIPADDAQCLSRNAKAFPSQAAAVFEQAIRLREAVYRIFFLMGSGAPPQAKDMEEFNRIMSPLMAGAGLISSDGVRWAWTGNPGALERLLWPIAWSAANLLASDLSSRVRECADHACGWLFVDASKNGKRQWCSMKGCGNRAKARRHYQKVKPED